MLRLRWWQWLGCGLLAGVFVIEVSAAGLVTWYHRTHHAQPMQWGVTFSDEYARSLGLDPAQTLNALLQLGVKHLRLESYWDEVEPEPGHFDYSSLDSQISQAKNAGADVILVVGQRQPRWPECHIPGWASGQASQLQIYLQTTINRYKNYNNIIAWQVENEPLNSFGQCPAPNRNQLKQEVDLVRQLDPARPVAMTASDEVGVPIGQPKGSWFGLSVYFEQWVNLPFWHGEVVYPLPAWWQALRAAISQKFFHQTVYIHELQAEPWGPQGLTVLPVSRQLAIYNAATFNKMTQKAQATDIKMVYLWGGEWWYWLSNKQHNNSLWQAAEALYR